MENRQVGLVLDRGKVGTRGWGLCDLAAGREGAPALPMVSVVEYRGLYHNGYISGYLQVLGEWLVFDR